MDKIQKADPIEKPLVTIIVPAYNEASVIERNLRKIKEYMVSIEEDYRWEMIVVDDGSTDGTGEIAEVFASLQENVRVLHQLINMRLAEALKLAFRNCEGDYVVTLDADLSYSVDHIGKLLSKIRGTHAQIVLASPYMRGGSTTAIPFLRRILSIYANKFLSMTSRGNLATLTSMVRAYDGNFLRALDLRANDVDIHAEIIYKAMILRARIREIPANLDWSFQRSKGIKRRSSMKILRGIFAYLLSGFTFRPFMFFVIPGSLLILIALYPITWAMIHTFEAYGSLSAVDMMIDHKFSAAVSIAFGQSPHSFIVGGVSLIVGIQLLSLGVLALQNKRYFEEIFHLGTTVYKQKSHIK
jgi:glycosyltransferase involved in cell wall biosynthesis